MTPVTPRVLVVEDDDAIRTLVVAALRREPFDVDCAQDGAAALEMTREFEYAAIVLDLMMPRLDGFEFLEAFHGATPNARSVIFVVTAFDDAKVAKLRPDQVHAVVKKPFDVSQLVTMIREVVLLWHTETQDAAPAQPRDDSSADRAEPAEPVN